MSEIFPREVAAHPEPFTGERLTSALSGQTQIEHYHRYLFARTLCRGLDVLDVASGEGYGSALLAQVARSIIGVEYSAPTVLNAAANFRRENLTFAQGDARALPLRSDCVDVAVSFETIEHFDRQDEFVAEVRRVLRPDGCFIVSTPDREIYSAPGTAPNPFHVREMSREEFLALLRPHFRQIALLVQRPVIGSVLLPDDHSAAPSIVFDRLDQARFEAGTTLPRAPYLVAIASDRALPALPASLYIDRSDLDSDGLALAKLRAEMTRQQTESAAEMTRQQAAAAAEIRRRQEATDGEITLLAQELVIARSSLRGFLRSYLPRLRRQMRGLWNG